MRRDLHIPCRTNVRYTCSTVCPGLRILCSDDILDGFSTPFFLQSTYIDIQSKCVLLIDYCSIPTLFNCWLALMKGNKLFRILNCTRVNCSEEWFRFICVSNVRELVLNVSSMAMLCAQLTRTWGHCAEYIYDNVYNTNILSIVYSCSIRTAYACLLQCSGGAFEHIILVLTAPLNRICSQLRRTCTWGRCTDNDFTFLAYSCNIRPHVYMDASCQTDACRIAFTLYF